MAIRRKTDLNLEDDVESLIVLLDVEKVEKCHYIQQEEERRRRFLETMF